MFGADMLTFREFMLKEPLPLSTIHDAVLKFLRGRDDVVVYDAHAVNAYVDEPRMTQDVDIMALNGEKFAEELRKFIADKFHIAVRVRNIRDGLCYRIYQVRKDGNRHLVDVRPVDSLPTATMVEEVPILAPAELVAAKVISFKQRKGKPKSGSDWRDLAILLLTFPELKTETGKVKESLESSNASPAVFDTWREIVETEITPESDEDEFQ
ncbi:MAG: hypothetical protein NUW37_04390 [Planctomycetes bacterium]|nr:hypothetical protein [Planctomycetota bacterium]